MTTYCPIDNRGKIIIVGKVAIIIHTFIACKKAKEKDYIFIES
jgi:hypothetical protein